MNIIAWILFIVWITLLVATVSASLWGNKECNKAGGNWVSMNGGKHCVDNNFKEIDIYK